MAGVGPLTFTGIRFLLGTAVVVPLAWREWQQLSARSARPQPRDALAISALGVLLMLGATLQRTAETRRAAPTPTMAPVIVWVVETGMPSAVARNRVMAPPVSAQNPCTG